MFFVLMVIFMFSVSAYTFKIGGYKIEYDTIYQGDSNFDGINDRKSYYLDGEMVLVTYDQDGDGVPENWNKYTEDVYIETAMRDENGDGKPNDFIKYDKEGNITQETSKRTFSLKVIMLVLIGVVLFFLVVIGIGKFFAGRKKKSKKSKAKNKKEEKTIHVKSKKVKKKKPKKV